jgi:hypothetical protein
VEPRRPPREVGVGPQDECIGVADPDGSRVFSDIIVHHRGTRENFLVVEVKKADVDDSRDREKLRAMTAHDGDNTLGYVVGVLVTLSMDGARLAPVVFEHGEEVTHSSRPIKGGAVNWRQRPPEQDLTRAPPRLCSPRPGGMANAAACQAAGRKALGVQVPWSPPEVPPAYAGGHHQMEVRRTNGACAGISVTEGRPRDNKALVAAKALLDQDWAWRAVSDATGVQKDTLRRRLNEAGMLAQNPTPADAASTRRSRVAHNGRGSMWF